MMNIPIETVGELFGPVTVGRRRSFNMQELVGDFPAGQTDWSLPEAYFCLILSAALADGRVADQEAEEIRSLSHRSRILRSLDPNELATLNRTVVQRRTDRSNWLAEACQALPADMHLSVFIHCLDICLADGCMVQAEADYLEAVLQNLSISEEEVRLATRILTARNRY